MKRGSRYKMDTCCMPGCTAQRYERGKAGRSRFCEPHFREHEAQLNADLRRKKGLPPRKVKPERKQAELTPRYVLNEWRHDRLCAVYHDGRRVLGLQEYGGAYRVQLEGADEGIVISALTRLSQAADGAGGGR